MQKLKFLWQVKGSTAPLKSLVFRAALFFIRAWLKGRLNKEKKMFSMIFVFWGSFNQRLIRTFHIIIICNEQISSRQIWLKRMLWSVGHSHIWDFGSLPVFRSLSFSKRAEADIRIQSQCFSVFFCLCLALSAIFIFFLGAVFLEILKKIDSILLWLFAVPPGVLLTLHAWLW